MPFKTLKLEWPGSEQGRLRERLRKQAALQKQGRLLPQQVKLLKTMLARQQQLAQQHLAQQVIWLEKQVVQQLSQQPVQQLSQQQRQQQHQRQQP
jgi:hypothetical protein